MKKNYFYFLCGCILFGLLCSCSVTNYFQISTIETDLEKNENYIIFENKDCMVYYNLWGDGGNMSYIIYNKTDSCIYLNMDKSFFIKNDYAYDMYDPNVYSFSRSVNKSSGNSYGESRSNAISVNGKLLYPFNFSGLNGSLKSSVVNYSQNSENIQIGSTNTTYVINEKNICIPPKAMKSITGYVIELTKYNCFSDKNKRKEFTRENSPLVFRNVIEYSFEENSKLSYIISNDFWLSKIEEYSDRKLEESNKNSSHYSVRKNKIVKSPIYLEEQANKFYITWSVKN